MTAKRLEKLKVWSDGLLNEVCAKCAAPGGHNISVTLYGRDHRVLCLTCKRCGYTWHRAALDNVDDVEFAAF
jgi:RNase P subunit RPR2